jgi:hypothetical protein
MTDRYLNLPPVPLAQGIAAQNLKAGESLGRQILSAQLFPKNEIIAPSSPLQPYSVDLAMSVDPADSLADASGSCAAKSCILT